MTSGDKIGVTGPEFPDNLRRSDNIYELIVHEKLLLELVPFPMYSNSLTYLQYLFGFGIHLIGYQGQIPRQEAPNKPCHNQYHRRINGSEAQPPKQTLIQIRKDKHLNATCCIFYRNFPVNVIGVEILCSIGLYAGHF